MTEKTTDRISYSEGVKINIGDYESRDVHISYSTDVKKRKTRGHNKTRKENCSTKFEES